MSSLGLRLASSSVARCSSAVLRFKSHPRGSRNIHERLSLPYPVEGGLGDFLPPEALKVVAIDYQEGLLKRLDEEVRGSPEAVESVAQTVLNTAPYKEKALAFNYASLALNNSYFLDQLLPPPTEGGWKNHQEEITGHMEHAIRQQYGTLVQLKSTFSSAVMGMFTSGWVWFVTDKNGRLGIVPTFGPGTLLIRSRSYMGLKDPSVLGSGPLQHVPKDHSEWGTKWSDDGEVYAKLEDDIRPLRSPTGSATSPTSPSPSSPVSGVSGGKQPPASPNALHPRFLSSTGARAEDSLTRKPDSLYNANSVTQSGNTARSTPKKDKVDHFNLGETLSPLFCISVHEHAWMAAGYGVWGKEAWLKQFWSVLNWKKVCEAYVKVFPDPSLQSHKVH